MVREAIGRGDQMTADELTLAIIESGLRHEPVLLKIRVPDEYGSYHYEIAEIEQLVEDMTPPVKCGGGGNNKENSKVTLFIIGRSI